MYITSPVPFPAGPSAVAGISLPSPPPGEAPYRKVSLGKFCGNTLPANIRTSGNVAKVVLHAGPSTSLHGMTNLNQRFKLSYNTSRETCGGEMNTPSGIITSPGYPTSNMYSRMCAWKITVPKGRRITVEVLDYDVDIAGMPGLWFFNGLNYESMITKFTTDTLMSTRINSTSNMMGIYFSVSRDVGRRGIKLRYTSDLPAVCGGDLTGDSGYISSPPESLNLSGYYCTWERVTPSTANETFTFTVLNGTFGTMPYPSCRYYGTHLSIRAAADEIKLADICANATTPLVYPSPFSMNKVLAIQNSEKSYGKMNFTLKYSSSPCGGVLNGPEETVSSPNYPNNYPPNTDCAWSVSYPEGQAIKIHFVSLNMEADCEKDSLLIHSGHVPSSPRIGRYCGNSPPSLITSHSNTLWIAFHSDAETQGQGFQLTLEPVTGGCGGIIIGANKEISTPNFPKSYPNNAECDWEIRVDDGYTIQLDFVERFYIENSSNCQNDFVEAFDYVDEQWVSLGRQCGRNTPASIKGTTNKMRVLFRSNSQIPADGFKQYFWTTTMTNLGTYCGNNIPPVIGQRNRIEVIFRTDRSIKKTGFMFQYEVETCGGNITEQRLIKSPVNNNQHNSRVRCNWLITAPVGKRVTLRFTSFKIEYHPACNYDYIEPYDDKTTSEKKRMGRYCGNLDSDPPTIHSTGPYLSLLFVTDGSNQGEGFLASVMFTTVCGGITNVSQQSQTLRYPASGKYATFLDCAWTLVAPLGQIVQLQITSLDLASCFNMSTASCDCDYLEVRDGVSQYSDLIGRFCGNTAPPAFTSTSNKMWVHFVSDGTENRNGFQAQVSSIASICGNSMLNVTSSLQELTSPNYPGNYPVNIRCRWLLSSGPVGNLWNNMNQIYIHFKELDLETGGDNCRNDRLQVSDIIRAQGGGRTIRHSHVQTCRELREGEGPSNTVMFKHVASSGWGKDHQTQSCSNMSRAQGGGRTIKHSHVQTCRELRVGEGPSDTVMFKHVASSGRGKDHQTQSCSNMSRAQGGGRTIRHSHVQTCRELREGEGPSNTVMFKHVASSGWGKDHQTQSCSNMSRAQGGGRTIKHSHVQTCRELRVGEGPSDTVMFKHVASSGRGKDHQTQSCSNMSRAQGGGRTIRHSHVQTCRELREGEGPSNTVMFKHVASSGWGKDHQTQSCSNMSRAQGGGRTIKHSHVQTCRELRGFRQPTGKGTFCGHGEPLDYYSNSANVEIVFISNFNVTARGFKIQYGLQGCNRNYTGVQGRIKLRPDAQDCIVTIQAQPNHTISLYFLEFYLMSDDICSNNFLEVRDGLTASSPRLAKLCGYQIPSPIFSNTSALRLLRHKNNNVLRGSYEVMDITYTTTDQELGKVNSFVWVPGSQPYYALLWHRRDSHGEDGPRVVGVGLDGPGCGGTLFNFGGVFTSPFYPGNYRNTSKCRWDVIVPTGLTVSLKFHVFDLGPSITCDSDYIEFFDFDVVTKVESFRTKYCGGDVPAVYEGVSAHVVVQYTSSVHNGGTGWVLHFMGKVPENGKREIAENNVGAEGYRKVGEIAEGLQAGGSEEERWRDREVKMADSAREWKQC
uniref:CUB domain-containing protein n=1 Tax=Timema genevievae TaxID=629358 RepID=A0A7R9PQ62_TIMGE|nr:unnamed protein product [Timema genevievae]